MLSDEKLKQLTTKLCKLIGCSGLNADCPGNHQCDIIKKLIKREIKSDVQ